MDNAFSRTFPNSIVNGSAINKPSNYGELSNSNSLPRATRSLTDAGVTLIHQQLPTAAVVSVDIWLPAGTASEPAKWSGVAHFMEHLVFKGTADILPGEFDWLIETHGGISNACTSLDYVHFSFTTATEYFAPALDCLARLLLQANVPDSEFERERSVVIEEMYETLHNPDWIAHQNLMSTVYGQHPYSRPVLGYEQTLRSLTAADLRQFHRRHYRPEQMTVAIVGNVDFSQAKAVVEDAFAIAIPAMISAELDIEIGKPNLDGELGFGFCLLPSVQVQQVIGLEQPRLTMAWLGCSVSELENALHLEILTMILAGGRTARLVKSLREQKGWVSEIDCDFTVQRSPGLFTVSALLDAHFLEPVEHQVQQQIESLSQTPVTAAELSQARRALLNQFAFMIESPGALASMLGYYGMLGCKALSENWNNTYSEILATATPASLQKLAQKYLPSDRYSITCLLPR